MTFTPDESKSMIRAALEGCSTASLDKIADVIADRFVVVPRESLRGVKAGMDHLYGVEGGRAYRYPPEATDRLQDDIIDLLSIADYLVAGGDDDARLDREALALYNSCNPPADELPVTWRNYWRDLARRARRVHGIGADGRQATDPKLHTAAW